MLLMFGSIRQILHTVYPKKVCIYIMRKTVSNFCTLYYSLTLQWFTKQYLHKYIIPIPLPPDTQVCYSFGFTSKHLNKATTGDDNPNHLVSGNQDQASLVLFKEGQPTELETASNSIDVAALRPLARVSLICIESTKKIRLEISFLYILCETPNVHNIWIPTG